MRTVRTVRTGISRIHGPARCGASVQTVTPWIFAQHMSSGVYGDVLAYFLELRSRKGPVRRVSCYILVSNQIGFASNLSLFEG